MLQRSGIEAVTSGSNCRAASCETQAVRARQSPDLPLAVSALGAGTISAKRDALVNARLVPQLQRWAGNRAIQRMFEDDGQDGQSSVDSTVERGIAASSGNGQALDQNIRPQMEDAFGADFGGVRIHTGPHADLMNRKVSAVAFTTGRDIFFSDGAYNPATTEGKGLLAHELTHVLQQRAEVATKLTLGSPGDAYEQEADRTAETVVKRLMAGPSALMRKCAACGETSVDPGLQRMCPECEKEEEVQRSSGSVRTSLIGRKGLEHSSIEVRHFGTGMLNREERNPWFGCREMGVPCPPASFFGGQTCRMIGCSRAATANLPFAVSPGICIFQCDDGSICTCVLVGSSSSAICTFKFCDSAARADTQDDFDNLALAAADAYKQQGPQQPDQTPGATEDPEQATA